MAGLRRHDVGALLDQRAKARTHRRKGNRCSQLGDTAPGNVSTTARCQQRSDVVDTSGALQSIGVYADVESNKLPNMCRYSVRPALSGRLLWDGLIGARIGPDLRYRRHHFADQPMP
jgi:hypothetical protein